MERTNDISSIARNCETQNLETDKTRLERPESYKLVEVSLLLKNKN